MNIDFSLPTENGNVRFKGEISEKQWNYIMQRGFLSLILGGAMLEGVVVINEVDEPAVDKIDPNSLN